MTRLNTYSIYSKGKQLNCKIHAEGSNVGSKYKAIIIYVANNPNWLINSWETTTSLWVAENLQKKNQPKHRDDAKWISKTKITRDGKEIFFRVSLFIFFFWIFIWYWFYSKSQRLDIVSKINIFIWISAINGKINQFMLKLINKKAFFTFFFSLYVVSKLS